MRYTKLLMVAALGLLAAPVLGADPSSAANTSTDGKKKKVAAEIPPPPAGSGQVVFYRSSRMGALISCRVRENGEVVNKLPPGKYFIHQTSPGPHEYTVKSEAKDRLRIEVEEGETHYVRCSINAGIGLGRPNLSPQSREDFDKRGRGLDLLPPFTPDDDKDDKDDKN